MDDLKITLTNFVNERDNNARVIFGTLYRQKALVKRINEYTTYLPKKVKLAQRTYHTINNITEIPTCKVCPSKVKFHSFNNGYNAYCSVKCANNDPIIQAKITQTCLVKYGTEYPAQNLEVNTRKKQTYLSNYGVDQPSNRKELQQRRKETCLVKYGVDYPAKSEKIKQKTARTLHATGTGPCSTQQKYIHDLIGGELNYPVGRCMLDIAFPEDGIYFEYDGGGHDLLVKRGDITQKQFEHKELKRSHFLHKKGWKKICLVSRKDFLPADSMLTLLTANANYILRKRSWITFDIDKSTIQTSKYSVHFDFGELQKVR